MHRLGPLVCLFIIASVTPGCRCACAPERGGGNADGATAAQELSRKELSALTGHIAFVRESPDAGRHVHLVRPDGTAQRALTSGPNAYYPAAAAPDGTSLLLIEVDESAGAHLERLLLFRLPSGPAVPLGPASPRTRSPRFAPDGGFVVFESSADSFSDLYLVRVDGSGRQRLTQDPKGSFEPALSPDGLELLFTSSRTGSTDVYRMAARPGEPVRLTAYEGEDWAPQWSGRGDWVSFLTTRGGQDHIYLMRPDGREVRRAHRPTPPDAKGSERDPVFSPDGGAIAYVVRDAQLHDRIFIAPVAGGTPTALTSGQARDDMPAWSPTGSHLVFVSDRFGPPQLLIARADGTGFWRVLRSESSDWLPLWLP